MTIKNVGQMALALPEFKSVNAANYPFSSGTAEPTEYGPSALICTTFGGGCDDTVSNSEVVIDYIGLHRESLKTSQLELNFPTISLDFAIVLDDSFFTKSNYLMELEDQSLSVLNVLLDEYFLAAGLERAHRKKYLSALNVLVANLIQSHVSRSNLSVGRASGVGKNNNPRKIDNRLMASLCDWLSDDGYIDLTIQPPQPIINKSHATSTVYPKDQLMRLVLKYRIKTFGPSVIIRVVDKIEIESSSNKKKKYRDVKRVIKIPETKSVQLKYKSHTRVLNDYFNFVSGVLFTLGDAEIFPYGQRVFNKTIDLGGRFYANYQQTPSHDRKKIKINGEKTIELDYKSIHYNILYSMAGIQLTGDPYIVDGHERNVIKPLSLRLVNIDSERGIKNLATMITESGKTKRIKTFERYAYQLHIYNIDAGKGLRVTPPYKSLSLNNHIHSIPEHTDGKQLVRDLLERHKAIRHLIGSKDIGLRLQNTDSNIMKDIMRTATSESIPLLFVHDSCICKYSDRARVKQIMIETYKSFTGFNIKVTQ